KPAATVTVESGRVSVDLTGCDDQRKSPTNATSSQTYSGVVYVLKCLIDPDIPVNDGFYRLIDIKSRPGSVVHAQHPAAVAAGWEIAMQLCDLLFRALAPALPGRVVAGTKGGACNTPFGGATPRSPATRRASRSSPTRRASPRGASSAARPHDRRSTS